MFDDLFTVEYGFDINPDYLLTCTEEEIRNIDFDVELSPVARRTKRNTSSVERSMSVDSSDSDPAPDYNVSLSYPILNSVIAKLLSQPVQTTNFKTGHRRCNHGFTRSQCCLLYTSPSPRD